MDIIVIVLSIFDLLFAAIIWCWYCHDNGVLLFWWSHGNVRNQNDENHCGYYNWQLFFLNIIMHTLISSRCFSFLSITSS